MIKQTDTSLFMLPPKAVQARLYQRLLQGIVNYKELGARIIREIKAAHAFRQVETVRELSRILLNVPIKEYQLIAQYYMVWCKCRELKYPADVLEQIIEQTQTYKTKALFSRGAMEGYKGNAEAAIYFYREALKTSPTASEYIEMVRSIAALKSQEGFHKSALKDLESLIPIMQHAEPRLYYDLLNSYAVELSEANRLQEAKNVSSLAVSSPFGPYYPEWQETYSEVNQKLHKKRSTVAVSIPKHKPKPRNEPVGEPNLAKILQFPKPKAKEFYKGKEMPTLTPIQWLAAMMKTKYGAFLEVFIPDAGDDIDRFCETYLDFVITFYD